VGPGGHHFGTAHTLSHYRNAFYKPIVSDRRGYDNWWDDGAADAHHRAHQVAKKLLAAYERPPANEAVEEELMEYVAKMKREREK
jgi:trimethylamine--corrinoid protein Co-methyltransferase